MALRGRGRNVKSSERKRNIYVPYKSYSENYKKSFVSPLRMVHIQKGVVQRSGTNQGKEIKQ